MRKPIILGGLAVLVTAAAGYLLVIAPQAAATARVQGELTAVQAANDAASAQIPVLRAQLENIRSSVGDLRALSAQVPAAIDLPALYAELDAVAARSGEGVEVSNVSVTIPALLNPPVAEPVIDPNADPALEAPADEAAVVDPADEAAAPAPSAVLASYQVNMTVKAAPAQAAAFIKALGTMSRLNVVSTSTFTSSGEERSVNVAATFYLQQVDVDGLAAQIEALAAGNSVTAEQGEPANG